MYEIRRYLSCAFVRTQAGVTSRVKGRFETRACTYVCTIYTPSSYISNEIKLTGTMREIILSLYIYMQVLRICLSNRGTPRRAEKLCHFHIFRPPLTSPISREIHLRSNLNFKPVKFCCWFCVSSRWEQKGEVELGEKTWTSLYASIRRGTAEEEKGVYRVDQLIRAL